MPDEAGELRRFAESLREAFRRVRSSSIPDEDKVRLTRRLLAVTQSAKHDIRVARRRLELLVAQLPRRPKAHRRSSDGGD
jgi:hypothetical protein